MEAHIPTPADCEVRSVIKVLNAQSMPPIEIHHSGLLFGEFRVQIPMLTKLRRLITYYAPRIGGSPGDVSENPVT